MACWNLAKTGFSFQPVLEQSEAAALFQTENEEIDRWRLVFSSCFGLGFKGSPWIWVGLGL